MIHKTRPLVPFFALLLLPCLLLWPLVFQGQAFLPAELLRDISPWRGANAAALVPWNPLMWDGMAEFYPWRAFYASTLHGGTLPLWNPHQFCGTPFVANSQSAVFYPLNLLFYVLPVWRAFGVSVLLHLFLTGCFAYLYLRGGLKLGRAASLLGAVSWQMCHWQVAWLELPTFLCVSAWLPLALLLVDRAANRPTLNRAVPLGLCLGLMLLAGHLQIALYCFGLILAYALFRILPLMKRQWTRFLPCTALALALAFGLAAPQLLPAVELARVSHRAGGAATWPAYIGYVRLALPPVHLVTLFAPGFYGNPTRGTYWGVQLNGGPGAYMENACYGGVLTFLLALAAVVGQWRTQAATRFWACAAAVSLLLALGTPLNAPLFFGIPGFAQTGSPGRILVLWSFGVATLAAIGTEALLSKNRLALRTLVKASALFALLAGAAFGLAATWIARNAPAGTLAANLAMEAGDLWRLPVGILLAAAAALWLHRRGRLRVSALGGSLAALAALDLLAAGYGFNRTSPPQSIYPVTPLIAYLQAHKNEGRIMPVNHRWNLYAPPLAILPPNAATVYGLLDTQGYDSLLTGQYFQFAAALDDGSPAPPENGNMVFTYGVGSPEARAASARFVVTREPLDVAGLILRFSDAGGYVYEDMKTLPRFRGISGENYMELGNVPTRVKLLREDMAAPQTIISDQWYPGWHALFQGEEAKVTRGPYLFRTISLNARQRKDNATNNPLELLYEPMSIRFGLFGLCLALGVMAAFGAAGINTRRPRSHATTSTGASDISV